MTENMIRIALQKSGRLHDKSITLLRKCGIEIEDRPGRLALTCSGFPLEIMLLRSEDIPEYVRDGVCQLGMLGRNVLEEKLSSEPKKNGLSVIHNLEYGACRLAMAIPKDDVYKGIDYFEGKKIATSYPATLGKYLRGKVDKYELAEISGSVEIAPALGISDAICDLVSTGNTLRTNGLKEVETILNSQAVLVKTGLALSLGEQKIILLLSARIGAVIKAQKSKYIMMNAQEAAIDDICRMIPGLETPTIIPLREQSKLVAIHAVCNEPIFWETMENLKGAGASSILVVPIEKIID
jgi:ATP phosphoribosyltransferase